MKFFLKQKWNGTLFHNSLNSLITFTPDTCYPDGKCVPLLYIAMNVRYYINLRWDVTVLPFPIVGKFIHIYFDIWAEEEFLLSTHA